MAIAHYSGSLFTLTSCARHPDLGLGEHALFFEDREQRLIPWLWRHMPGRAPPRDAINFTTAVDLLDCADALGRGRAICCCSAGCVCILGRTFREALWKLLPDTVGGAIFLHCCRHIVAAGHRLRMYRTIVAGPGTNTHALACGGEQRARASRLHAAPSCARRSRIRIRRGPM